jgi:hypothetical protein
MKSKNVRERISAKFGAGILLLLGVAQSAQAQVSQVPQVPPDPYN